MSFGGVITLIAVLGLLAVGMFITYPLSSLKDRRKLLFGLMCLSLASWVLSNYLSDLDVPRALFWINVSFSSIVIAVYAFLLFGYYFPEREIIPRWTLYGISVLTLATLSVIFSPYFIAGVRIEGGISTVLPGPLYPIFIVYFFLTFGYSFYRLLWRRRRLKGRSQLQVDYALVAIVSVAIVGSITNLILPLIVDNNNLYQIGSASSVLFVAIIGYSMVRHRLFNIRLAVARAVIYLLSLGFIVLSYGILLLLISSLRIVDGQSIQVQRVEFVGFAMLSALTYPRLKEFFTKITNKILYQDAYDPEKLFNALNRVVAANIELDKLLANSIGVIKETLKPEVVAIAIRQTSADRRHVVGALSRRFDQDVLDVIEQKQESAVLPVVVVTDSLPEDGNHELLHSLRRSDVGAVATLSYRALSRRRILGHIVLGPKKSGHPYDAQDIDVLEAVANEMVIAIQNSLRFEEIQKFNITLQDEVDTATHKLKLQNRRLEELDNIKDDFISMASHQLRTPLTSVKGYLSMVMEGDAGKLNREQDKMLRQAFASSQRMVFLITDLLNVSRLKTGKFVMDAVPTDLSEMISEELLQLEESAKLKSITLKYAKPKQFPMLMLDQTKLRQVIMNFVDNALYYTPAGGRIRVELTDTPSAVELRVVDNGIGVPKAEQHHLFTKFYRAANARKARPDGTGLGLFMAQKVIIAEGGSVIFSSQEGKGSTFGFRLPKAKLRVPENSLQGSDKDTLQRK